MRFYHIDVGTIYTLDEFLRIQSTKKDTIELQMTEVCINILFLLQKLQNYIIFFNSIYSPK